MVLAALGGCDTLDEEEDGVEGGEEGVLFLFISTELAVTDQSGNNNRTEMMQQSKRDQSKSFPTPTFSHIA